MNAQTFVFFGIAGSGKGTQVKLLMDLLNQKDSREIVYAYPGNEFRKIINSETQTSSLVKRTLDVGGLQPDFLTNALFINILLPNIGADKHLIVDGYPRRVAQSECFDESMKFYNRENVKIIYLEVGKEEVIKRMKLRARHDDTEEGMTQRFNEYVNNVVPAMNLLKDKIGYEFYVINGEQSVEDVHKDIVKALSL